MFAPLITLSKSFLCSALSSFSWYSCAAFLLLWLSAVSLCLYILCQLFIFLHLFVSCFLSVNTVSAVNFGCIYVFGCLSLSVYCVSCWSGFSVRQLSLLACISVPAVDRVVSIPQLSLYVRLSSVNSWSGYTCLLAVLPCLYMMF
jgi:hypothetical protein